LISKNRPGALPCGLCPPTPAFSTHPQISLVSQEALIISLAPSRVSLVFTDIGVRGKFDFYK
jgi:hypothetical protein